MTIKQVTDIEQLKQILTLQQENLFENVSPERRKNNGFVTVKHDLSLLEKMNEYAPQIIAIDQDKVAAYALVMLKELRNFVPVLVPMFEMFDNIVYHGKKICDYNYYVMGQICVAESHRGQGIFEGLYQKHKDVYSKQFDFCITEVSTSNSRSMRAHEKVGFKTVHKFRDAVDEWNIVVWNWE